MPEGVIVYDIGNGKFDHHQKGGNGCRPENGVPYAACGLLWKEFGRELLKISEVSSDLIEFVWFLIDRDLIQGIDAADNGVLPKTDYPAQGLTISQMVSAFNPNWDNKKSADEAFLEAVAFAEQVFDNLLANALSKAKARAIVEEAIQASAMHIMVLEQFVPWQDFIFASKNEKAAEIQFVVFPSLRGGYNWQCVPDSLGGFGQRKPVPADWKGLKDADLQEVTGIPTATFCHPAGFMGTAETFADALNMAKLAAEA